MMPKFIKSGSRRNREAPGNVGESASDSPDGYYSHAQKMATAFGLTAKPAAASNAVDVEPEFVRVGDLRGRCGLKRGLTYRKIKDGTFKSITLREPGNKFGVRLVYWPSVKKWLHGLLNAQNSETQ